MAAYAHVNCLVGKLVRQPTLATRQVLCTPAVKAREQIVEDHTVQLLQRWLSHLHGWLVMFAPRGSALWCVAVLHLVQRVAMLQPSDMRRC